MICKTAIRLSLTLAFTCCLLHNTYAGNGYHALRSSVVKIYATGQRFDYLLPWQTTNPRAGTGSGFVIKGKRLLTNAHVVSDARFLEVKKEGDPRRYRAEVAFFGHDCDLAILTVADPSFFEGTRPVSFADDIPDLSDTVVVLGYPMGGERLSLTEGVVSRIDHSVYSHSGVDSHLALQVDAAINPGNSGGPVFFKKKVVGVAFQGLRSADNIGYCIPGPVIKHFLDDVKDGTYNGYPELGVYDIPMRNSALRKSLKLPDDMGGVAVNYIDPFGAAYGHLRGRDVLLELNGYTIEEDGSIELEGAPVTYTELMERKQWGETLNFKIWRNGQTKEITFQAENAPDSFIFRNVYNERPRYVMVAGMVFSPLSREVLRAIGRDGLEQRNAQQLLYAMQYAKRDEFYKEHDEFVVLTTRLPHQVNTYAAPFRLGMLTEVNGMPIRALIDLPRALASPRYGFHVLRFAGMDDDLVIRVSDVASSEAEILAQYRVSAPAYLGESTTASGDSQ